MAKIKATIKKDSPAADIIKAAKEEKQTFKEAVESGNSKQQTAVEWLESEIKKIRNIIPKVLFEKAKQMEKQQIVDATYASIRTGEDYYNETFKSKGSYVAERLVKEMPKHIADLVDAYAENITNLEKLITSSQTEKCCTPEGQIKRYVDCIGCDKKPELRYKDGTPMRKYNSSKLQKMVDLLKENDTSPQTEISDKEALKFAKDMNKQPMTFTPNEISDEEIERKTDSIWFNDPYFEYLAKEYFMHGAKWYREQLKNKQ